MIVLTLPSSNSTLLGEQGFAGGLPKTPHVVADVPDATDLPEYTLPLTVQADSLSGSLGRCQCLALATPELLFRKRDAQTLSFVCMGVGRMGRTHGSGSNV